MLHPFIFSTIAFIILGGTEDLCAEEPILLGFEGPIIDGLWFLYLSVGPRLNLLWRSDGDTNGIKINGTLSLFNK